MEKLLMTRLILLSLTLSIATTLLAQEGTRADQQVTDLKTQLRAEHERVQQLLDAVQQLQLEVKQLQGGTQDKTQPVEEKLPTSPATAASAAADIDTSKTPNSEQPLAIQFRGITLTPGGFPDATGIYRTHNENADAISTFGAIPFEGTTNANLSEFRGTARETRLSLLAEGNLKNWKASGYAEIDFEGAAPTANEIESNSFQPRARQLWGQVEFNNGFSISGGQTWSLLTTSRKGIALRQEWVPNTIDLQYVVGYNWARQWAIRATKNFNNKAWAAVSIENPETCPSSKCRALVK
jgi:hypothetical protein